MSHTLSIDLLRNDGGACLRDSSLLRQIFPSGVIVFERQYLQAILDRQINILWAAAVLAPSVLTEISLGWYDRAFASLSPSWKAALRALVVAPETEAASAQLQARLAERRVADPADEEAVCVAGVGYAAAAFAVKLAEQPFDPERGQSAVCVLSQWCARCIAHTESVSQDSVVDQMKIDIWEALEQHGATL